MNHIIDELRAMGWRKATGYTLYAIALGLIAVLGLYVGWAWETL